jgi:hypothetical protein
MGIKIKSFIGFSLPQAGTSCVATRGDKNSGYPAQPHPITVNRELKIW